MDALGDITTYRVQLEQVEAALVGEPDNDELLRLKADLVDIIALTEDLMGVTKNKNSEIVEEFKEEKPPEPKQAKKPSRFTSLYDDEDGVEVAPSSTLPPVKRPPPPPKSTDSEVKVTLTNSLINANVRRAPETHKVEIIDEKEREYRQQLQELKMLTVEWKPGDKCQALNPETNQFNEAEVLCKGEGYLQIKYLDSGIISNILLSNVRKMKKRRWGEVTSSNSANKKITAEDKEKKKKKKLNRKAKQAEMEEAKEAEKKSWLTFMKSNKRANKNSTKKSIFASPDNFDGKIGIGTCGIAGKGMTSFAGPDKWKK